MQRAHCFGSCLYRSGMLPLPLFFFFNDTATTEIYTLSLHDALPILDLPLSVRCPSAARAHRTAARRRVGLPPRSEEHTSELQSRLHLVCRLLLEKKKSGSGVIFNALGYLLTVSYLLLHAIEI